MKRTLLAVAAGLIAGGAVMAAVVMPSSATTTAVGTAMTPGQTIKLASNVTLVPLTPGPIYGPVNTKYCGGPEIYVDSNDWGAFEVGASEASLKGQVVPINLPSTAGGAGFIKVVPTPSLEVGLGDNANPGTPPATVNNIYVYCPPPGG